MEIRAVPLLLLMCYALCLALIDRSESLHSNGISPQGIEKNKISYGFRFWYAHFVIAFAFLLCQFGEFHFFGRDFSNVLLRQLHFLYAHFVIVLLILGTLEKLYCIVNMIFCCGICNFDMSLSSIALRV